MCGLAGILFSRDDEVALGRRLDDMMKALSPRGPDEQGKVLLRDGGLGHTRLVLLDAQGGKQPMCDPSGRYWLTFNGQIYNHREIRHSLAPCYEFRTRSDTEVLLAAFILLGESCLDRLDGMFAFCVWDALKREAFAARDALGVKPFVYASHKGEFLFASECKALLRGWDKPTEVNESALAELVVVPSLSGVREPMFEGMEYLPAGHKMRITADAVRTERWFQYHVGDNRPSSNFHSEELRTALVESVRSTMNADCPVGSMVSGGVDSSLLASLACRNGHGREGALKAYTIRFDSHDTIDFNSSSIVISDDAPFVEELARGLPLDLHRVQASQKAALEHLDSLAQVNDRVPAWEQELSQYFLARAAARDCKAVLVGDAADETHYGYFFLLRDSVNHGPRGLMDLFSARERAACLCSRLRRSEPLERLESEYTSIVEGAGYRFGGDPGENTQAMSYLVVALWLGRLLHNGDVHNMAHGLEARVPFANRGVLKSAQAVPPALGFKDEVEKFALRQAAAPFLPRSICWRKKSALPRDPRLGRAYQQRLLALLEESQSFAGQFLDLEEVRRLCRKPALPENERILLFNLTTLIYWGRYYCGA